MTTTLVLNLIAAIFILVALAGVMHAAHRVARLPEAGDSVAADEPERLAA